MNSGPICEYDVAERQPKAAREAFERGLLKLMEPYRFRDGQGFFNFMDVDGLEALRTLKDLLKKDKKQEIREGNKETKGILNNISHSAQQRFLKGRDKERLRITGKIAELIDNYFPELAQLLRTVGAAEVPYSAVLVKNLVSPELVAHAKEDFDAKGRHYSNPSIWAGYGCNRLVREGTCGHRWEEKLTPRTYRPSLGKIFQPHRDEPDIFWPETLTISAVIPNPGYVTGVVNPDLAVKEALRANAVTLDQITALCKMQFHTFLPNEASGKEGFDADKKIPLLIHDKDRNKYHLSNAILAFPGDKTKQYVALDPDKLVDEFIAFNRQQGASAAAIALIDGPYRAIYKYMIQQSDVTADLPNVPAKAKRERFGTVLGNTDSLTVVQHPLHPNHTYHWVKAPPGIETTKGARVAAVVMGQASPLTEAKKWAENVRVAHSVRQTAR